MTIPDFQSITLPLLRLLADGETRRLSDLTDRIADQFQLTESERKKKGGQNVFHGECPFGLAATVTSRS